MSLPGCEDAYVVSLFRRNRRQPPVLPEDCGTPDREGHNPADLVVSYLDALYAWELRAFKAAGADGALPPQVLADLGAIRGAHLTSRALATNTTVSFGNAPASDTNGMTVLDVTQRDPRHALVRTTEYPYDSRRSGLDPQGYEYRLALVDGRWRLNSRTTKDWDDHKIRGLL